MRAIGAPERVSMGCKNTLVLTVLTRSLKGEDNPQILIFSPAHKQCFCCHSCYIDWQIVKINPSGELFFHDPHPPKLELPDLKEYH